MNSSGKKKSRKTPQKNLTGHHRKLKDLAATVHINMTKWESLNAQGSSILTDIVNTKLKYKHDQIEADASEENQLIAAQTLSKTLNSKCELLQEIFVPMEEIVNKFLSMKTTLEGMKLLLQHQGESDNIIFEFWTIHDFVKTLGSVHTNYAQELCSKKTICENVGLVEKTDLLMCYSSAWLHQPFIKCKQLVSDLLVETGH